MVDPTCNVNCQRDGCCRMDAAGRDWAKPTHPLSHSPSCWGVSNPGVLIGLSLPATTGRTTASCCNGTVQVVPQASVPMAKASVYFSGTKLDWQQPRNYGLPKGERLQETPEMSRVAPFSVTNTIWFSLYGCSSTQTTWKHSAHDSRNTWRKPPGYCKESARGYYWHALVRW